MSATGLASTMRLGAALGEGLPLVERMGEGEREGDTLPLRDRAPEGDVEEEGDTVAEHVGCAPKPSIWQDTGQLQGVGRGGRLFAPATEAAEAGSRALGSRRRGRLFRGASVCVAAAVPLRPHAHAVAAAWQRHLELHVAGEGVLQLAGGLDEQRERHGRGRGCCGSGGTRGRRGWGGPHQPRGGGYGVKGGASDKRRRGGGGTALCGVAGGGQR